MTHASDLRRVVTGAVYTQSDDEYESATRTWDLSTPCRPPLVLVAHSVADIGAGARWADDHDLGIALLNTGHGAFSGHEDALVIVTTQLNTVRIDPLSNRATVAPGARWSDVATAASPRGLVGASGGSMSVGVIGYTLGGGLGPLGRTLGFAADRVTSLTVLDADYRPRRLGPHDEDLFWALRGGGPLGIVTALEFELASTPAFYGGGIYFAGTHAEALLSAYVDWVDGLDSRTTTSIALIRMPPAPQLPAELRGEFVVHLRFAHLDPHAVDLAADSARILGPMLGAAPIILDHTRIMAPEELPDIHRDPVAPQSVVYRGALLDDLDPAAITDIVDSIPATVTAEAPSLRMVELRHLGGVYDDPPASARSSTGRHSRFNL
ncbi:FAD-binding oxidoreductase, partial [Agreia sp.]|uniref:FAD-binding oxidoreductase n=1 Tax=Agreia sp. TaxID=1872416 RepID=UPI0035BC48B1